MKTVWFRVKYNNEWDNVDEISSEQVQDGYSEAETEAVLILPDSYAEKGSGSDAAPVPLIFSAHGSGGRVSESEGHTGGTGYASNCLDTGYAVFDIHGTRPDGRSYGNRRYCEAVFNAYRYILAHFNVEPGLFVCGASMGGVSALNYVNLYPSTVRVLGLFYPRINLTAVDVGGVRINGSWEAQRKFDSGETITDIISEQYGFPGKRVWDEERARGLNPWNNRTVTVDGKRYTFLPCPVKIWHGNHDTTVDYAASTEYIAGVRRAGCYGELRTLELTKHKHGEIMHEELRLWFDRFRGR
ncbi:MAG: alpha/beta hydrolase [Clostridia bacterium]|nr:alpha/beta hydrolase [Clostridia bacterium]